MPSIGLRLSRQSLLTFSTAQPLRNRRQSLKGTRENAGVLRRIITQQRLNALLLNPGAILWKTLRQIHEEIMTADGQLRIINKPEC